MRGGIRSALLLSVLLLLAGPPASAFRQSIHQEMTEIVLSRLGFDADSADEAGDANWFTDVYEPTNSAAHFDNEDLSGGSARLSSLLDSVIEKLTACDRTGALAELGRALHTLQDLYSHSNAVNNTIQISDFMRLPNPSLSLSCAPPGFAPAGLTSGYFSLSGYLNPFASGGECNTTPPNKCCHKDLHKDDPGRPLHAAAREAAEQATAAYIAKLEQRAMERTGPTAAAYLMKLLKRKQRQLALVIDDTGSMYDDIANVQAAVNALLDGISASGEAPQLNLITFKDEVTDRGRTCNLEQFRAQVNALFASGGGDCPEASNTALLRGIAKAGFGGQVILATDASARDWDLGPLVYQSAASRGISISAILTGDCFSYSLAAAGSGGEAAAASGGAKSGADRSAAAADPPAAASPEADLTSPFARRQLTALTALTGGILFSVPRSEVDQAARLLLDAGRPDTALLMNAVRDLAPGNEWSLPVQVDGAVSAVTFVVNVAGGSLDGFQLVRPDGIAVNAADPGVTLTSLTGVRAYTIQAPASGEWRLRLAGSGRAAVQVFAATTFDLTTKTALLDPDVRRERPEVESKPLQGQPVAGQPLLLEMRFRDDPSSVLVRLVRADGTVLQEIPASRVRPRYYRASFVPPAETFSVAVAGAGPGGPFQRLIRQQFRAQRIRVQAPAMLDAPLGSALRFQVSVENFGPSGNFAVRAVSARGFPVSAPASLSIQESASASFQVVVDLPAAAPGISDDLVTISVQDAANPLVANSASVRLNILNNRAPDCSGATLQLAGSLWPPTGKLIPGSIRGVSDPDGDPVAIEILSIQQSEPTLDLGSGSGNRCPDARILGLNAFELRSERHGTGDGRQYRVQFRATDGKGGSCEASVAVCLPHDAGKPLCKVESTPFDSARCP